MRKTRVLIVDDSAMTRSMIREILESAGDFEVVGEAVDGRQAVDMAALLTPDIITMDLEMPVMGGMEAIDVIMRRKAIPILVVSDVAHAKNALQALDHGALEAMAKPGFSDAEAKHFSDRVRMLAGVSVLTRMRSFKPSTAVEVSQRVALAPSLMPGQAVDGRVFAIASSTGGTQALAQILPSLPADFPSAVLIAQHISDGFAAGLAEWLNSLCKLPVRLAAEGDLVQAGRVLISPSEHHLAVLPNNRVTLMPRKDADIYHPSCDVLLESVARVYGERAVGIILTGMGRDGAAGIGHIRGAGGHTVAQDEASSLIYGMNRVAVESGKVQQLLSLGDMASAMQRLAGLA